MTLAEPIIVTIAIGDGHKYAIAYRPSQAAAAIAAVERWARSPDLPFDWLDATRMKREIQREAAK